MADQESDDRTPPWTIKGIGPEARNAAIQAAKREKQTIGEWITRAIRSQVQSDRQQDRAPVLVGPVPVVPGTDRASDLDEIERIVGMIKDLSGSGADIPRGVARSAYSVVRAKLAQIRGQTGRAKSQTFVAGSQTGEPGET